jgi:hypothetical protein
MIALLLAATAPASAGELLVSGGFSAMPTASDVIVPSWRIGVRAGRVTPWVSAMWASLQGAENADVDAWGLIPRLGARLDFGDRTKTVVPFGGLSVSTVLGHAVADDTEPENNPFDFDSGVPPINVALGAGLDARIHEALSISVELGADYVTSTATTGGDTLHVGAFLTYGAIHLNIWLGSHETRPSNDLIAEPPDQ